MFVDARAMKPEFDAPESARLHSVYGRRDANPAVQARYGPFNPANLFICQQRQREVLALLRKHGLHTLDGQDILDVGCGAGDVLVEFLGYGAAPACLHGVDLLSARLTKARARLPNSALSRADAQSLPYPDDTFSVVLQYTAFSSILDDEVRQNAASEMLRVMKPDGLILWYDFWLNPVNPETRGIKQKEVRHLFPSCRFDFHRTTLAPPVTRVLAKHSLLLCYLLERIPLMCTHYLVAITKRGA